jgi:hypothetical protein
MREQIERGRTLLVGLLGAVSIIFVVNVFYPLYLSPPDRSPRVAGLCLMLALSALAYKGVPSMRAAISGILFFFALIDSLVLFSALAKRDFRISALVGGIMAGFIIIGWLLLFSKSVRAFEAARKKRLA